MNEIPVLKMHIDLNVMFIFHFTGILLSSEDMNILFTNINTKIIMSMTKVLGCLL